MTKSERIVATSDAIETEAYYVETESSGEWTRSPTRYYSVGAAVAYARAFLDNWRIVEVTSV